MRPLRAVAFENRADDFVAGEEREIEHASADASRNGMSARIREYAAADQSAVVRLVERVLAEYGFSVHVGGIKEDLDGALDRYVGVRAGFWVAEMEGEVVGTVAVRPKEGATCELKRLYLRADARGSGLGRSLYAHAESFARGAGYDRISLESSRRFVKARRLYEKNGFVLVEEIDNEWEDNVYEKALR